MTRLNRVCIGFLLKSCFLPCKQIINAFVKTNVLEFQSSVSSIRLWSCHNKDNVIRIFQFDKAKNFELAVIEYWIMRMVE